MSDEKIFISANELLADSMRLGRQVLDSGFAPTHLVGIWRGGAPVGIAVQELLDYHGQHCDHIAIRTSSYHGIDRQDPEVKVFALGYLIDTLDPDDRLLIIDDRSEEHTSELQSLMRISYAVFCLKKKITLV